VDERFGQTNDSIVRPHSGPSCAQHAVSNGNAQQREAAVSQCLATREEAICGFATALPAVALLVDPIGDRPFTEGTLGDVVDEIGHDVAVLVCGTGDPPCPSGGGRLVDTVPIDEQMSLGLGALGPVRVVRLCVSHHALQSFGLLLFTQRWPRSVTL